MRIPTGFWYNPATGVSPAQFPEAQRFVHNASLAVVNSAASVCPIEGDCSSVLQCTARFTEAFAMDIDGMRSNHSRWSVPAIDFVANFSGVDLLGMVQDEGNPVDILPCLSREACVSDCSGTFPMCAMGHHG